MSVVKIPFGLGVWLIFVHSLLKHKEFRFVYPLLPLAATYVGMFESVFYTYIHLGIITLYRAQFKTYIQDEIHR